MPPWTDAVIDTPRLRLRASAESDRPVILSLLIDPDVRRHLGGPVDDAQLAAARSSPIGETPGRFCVADRADGRMIGAVSVGDQHGEPEVSYVFVPEVWGRGLAGEALTALLGWLWSETSHASVIAVTQTANARSCQLLERLGFTFEREFVEWNAAQSQYRLDRS